MTRATRAEVPACVNVKRDAQNTEDGRADREPQQAVPEQQAGERHEPRIALVDRPVFGQLRVRRDAERVEHRRDRLVVHVAQQSLRRQVADQGQHAADVDRQHPPRQRGEQKNNPPRTMTLGSRIVA